MNRSTTLAATVLLVFATMGICYADSLVITYHSGKTQTVVLDEPSQAINSWKFVGGATPQEQIKKDLELQPESNRVPVEKAPEKKSGVRVKWNAKPISD